MPPKFQRRLVGKLQTPTSPTYRFDLLTHFLPSTFHYDILIFIFHIPIFLLLAHTQATSDSSKACPAAAEEEDGCAGITRKRWTYQDWCCLLIVFKKYDVFFLSETLLVAIFRVS
jgi:hypothetical protein